MHVRCMHAHPSKMVEIACREGNVLGPHVLLIDTTKHGILKIRIFIMNFALSSERPVAGVTSFGEAVECYGEKLAGCPIKTYWATTTWLRLEYRHAPNHYGFRGATS